MGPMDVPNGVALRRSSATRSGAVFSVSAGPMDD